LDSNPRWKFCRPQRAVHLGSLKFMRIEFSVWRSLWFIAGRHGSVALPTPLPSITSSKLPSQPELPAPKLGAVGYSFRRFPDAADLSMAAMSSWRRTASAKSGTV
jgi:hypothetical protein